MPLIRPMKTTFKGRAVVFIITRSSVCGGEWEPRCHCGGLSHGQCSHGKCYAKTIEEPPEQVYFTIITKRLILYCQPSFQDVWA